MKNEMKALRQEARLTQQQLAEILAVSRQTIHAIETGKYDPSLTLAFAIARHFQKPIEEIFEP